MEAADNRHLYATKLFSTAFRIYQRLRTEVGETALLRTEWGAALAGAGNAYDAYQNYQAAIALDPDYIATRLNLGYLYQRLGLTRQANDAFRFVTKANFAKTVNSYEAAFLAHELELGRKALQSLAYLDKGYAHLALGNLKQANPAFQAAVTADTNNAQAHLGLGIIAFRQQQWSTALAHFETARELDPQLEQAILGVKLSQNKLEPSAKESLSNEVIIDILQRRPDWLFYSLEQLSFS